MEDMKRFECNGNTLCPALIDELINVRRQNRRRLEIEWRKEDGKDLNRYRAVHRQLRVVNLLIKIGRQPLTPQGLRRCAEIYCMGELYAIGD
uniref:Transposase n=1 Tax=Caenorhabditis tropicalis TaxID=1561998 RepID=A0A1I7US03_9PELO